MAAAEHICHDGNMMEMKGMRSIQAAKAGL
jgi:hypothetical protein